MIERATHTARIQLFMFNYYCSTYYSLFINFNLTLWQRLRRRPLAHIPCNIIVNTCVIVCPYSFHRSIDCTISMVFQLKRSSNCSSNCVVYFFIFLWAIGGFTFFNRIYKLRKKDATMYVQQQSVYLCAAAINPEKK